MAIPKRRWDRILIYPSGSKIVLKAQGVLYFPLKFVLILYYKFNFTCNFCSKYLQHKKMNLEGNYPVEYLALEIWKKNSNLTIPLEKENLISLA